MTVSNQTNVVQYNGNGATVTWPTGFRFFKNTDLVVTKRSAAGVTTLLTLNTDYSVTGANSLGGGNVITTSALATGDLLTIARVLTVQQLTDLRNQGDYFAEIHEDVFDYLTMLIQQTGESDSRALRHPRDSEHYQAQGRRIVDLEDPVDPQDAVTKSWLGSFIDSVSGLINNTAGIAYDAGTLFDFLRFGVSRTVDSIAALRALSGSRNQRAMVLGYYGKGDGGGGQYFVDQADILSIDNGGTIIVAADGSRWKLVRSGAVSLKQFGAKFDGSTDDTSAINSCIAAAGPGVIYAPAGTCRTQGGHTLLSGQYVLGAGKNSTIFFNAGMTSDTFKIDKAFCGLKDLTITGTLSRTAGTHVNCTGAPSHTYLERLSIFNFADSAIKMDGVVQYVDAIDVSMPTIVNGSGFIISGGNDQYIRGITMDGRVGGTGPTQCSAGFRVTKSGGVWLSDSDFIHCQNGVLLVATGTDVVQFMFFDNVACDTSGNNGWNIVTAGSGTINNCAFNGCWGASSVNSGLVVSGVTNSINGLAFSNFRAIGNGGDGFFIQSGALNVTVTGGLFSGNSLTTTLTNAGIRVGANMSDVAITGARCGPTGSASDTQLNQIQVDSGIGDRISIVGCNVKTTRTPILFGATGANNTISGCAGVILKGRLIATTDAQGRIVVTHNNGFVFGTILATVQNDGSGYFAQWTGAGGTTNFQLRVFTQSGTPLASSPITISWQGDI